MNTLFIIFKGKFIQLFRSWKSLLKLGGILLALGGVLLYSWLFTLIFTSDSIDAQDIEYTEMAILWSLTLLGVLKDFFPSYRDSTGLIGPQYPVSTTRSWLLIIFADFMHFFWMCVLVFALTMVTLIPQESQLLLLKLALLLSAVPPLSFSIRQLIDFNRSNRMGWASSLLAACAVPITLVATNQPASVIFPLFGLFSIAIWFYSFRLYRQPVLEQRQNKTIKNANNPFRWFSLNHKELRKVTLMSFFFKALFLSVFSLSNSDMITNEIILIVFLSPVFIFSYFGNNLWGIARGVWLTMHRLNASWSRRFLVYLNILFLPLLADAVITTGFIIFIGDQFLFLIGFYLTSLILLTFGGFWSSLQFPKFIDNTISFAKNTTSIAANLLTMIAMGFLISAYYNSWFYLFWIFPVLGTALAFMYTIQNHRLMSDKVFETLTAGD